MAKILLLKGGTVLTHDSNDHIHAIRADVVVDGKLIVKIEKDILPPDGSEIIDCTNKILSPGFIDTHIHVWQSLLKGRHANHQLLDYFPSGISPLAAIE